MPDSTINSHLREQLAELKSQGLYKSERRITTPQNPGIAVAGKEVVNFCANNYLGLANHPEIVAAARLGLDEWGFGLSSVRFICGTQEIHKRAERQIAEFFAYVREVDAGEIRTLEIRHGLPFAMEVELAGARAIASEGDRRG